MLNIDFFLFQRLEYWVGCNRGVCALPIWLDNGRVEEDEGNEVVGVWSVGDDWADRLEWLELILFSFPEQNSSENFLMSPRTVIHRRWMRGFSLVKLSYLSNT